LVGEGNLRRRIGGASSKVMGLARRRFLRRCVGRRQSQGNCGQREKSARVGRNRAGAFHHYLHSNGRSSFTHTDARKGGTHFTAAANSGPSFEGCQGWSQDFHSPVPAGCGTGLV